MTRLARRVAWGVLGALVLVGLVWAFLPGPIEVETATVARGRFEQVIEEDGRTRVRERYTINAPGAGQLERIELEEGDGVEPGDLLARIAPSPPALLDVRARGELVAREQAAEDAYAQALAGLRRAEAAVGFARSERDRARLLSRQGAIAAREADRAELELQTAERERQAARAAVRVAAHEREVAHAQLQEGTREGRGSGPVYEVRAPAGGRVLRVHRKSAGFVGPGEVLMELGDPGALEVVVDLLTEDAVGLAPGAAVELVRWGGAAATRGRVARIDRGAVTRLSALGVEEQRVDVVVELQDPPEEWSGVGDEFRVEARMLAFAADGVLKVPLSALFRQAGAWAVFVVDGGRAGLRRVELGRSNGVERILEKGLREGEVVVVDPPAALRDGARVDARAAP